MAVDENIPQKKHRHQTHGLEVFRDVYLSITGGEPTKRFGVASVSEMFNDVYTPNPKETAFSLESNEKMKQDGFFYVPPRLLRGDVTVKTDFNMIDEFSLTLLANFMTIRNLNIQTVSGKPVTSYNFAGEVLPYYPLMDTILLGTLWAKCRFGYVQNPEQSITVEGMCTGITPSFRQDGIPSVTYTFRDIGWEMARVNLSATYPNLGKDADLQNASNAGVTLNPDGDG